MALACTLRLTHLEEVYKAKYVRERLDTNQPHALAIICPINYNPAIHDVDYRLFNPFEPYEVPADLPIPAHLRVRAVFDIRAQQWMENRQMRLKRCKGKLRRQKRKSKGVRKKLQRKKSSNAKKRAAISKRTATFRAREKEWARELKEKKIAEKLQRAQTEADEKQQQLDVAIKEKAAAEEKVEKAAAEIERSSQQKHANATVSGVSMYHHTVKNFSMMLNR